VLLAMLLAIAPSFADLPLRAGTLASVTPLGASVGIAISITGTGFNTTAASNEVTFTHTSGATATATGTVIQTVNATLGLRRLRVTVPAGLPSGTAALRVRNLATGEISAGQNLEIVTFSLSTGAGARGATSLAIRITGSPNSQFVTGTRATFGSGITVHSTTVESPTSLMATVSVAPTAPLGPGVVSVLSSTQTASIANAFTIVDPNRPPAIISTAPGNGDEGALYSYQVIATDPDNDALSFRLLESPSGMTISPTGLVTWTPSGAQVGSQSVQVEAADGRGGIATQAFSISIAAAPALESIDVTPGSVRLESGGATQQLDVTGRRSNGSTVALTTAAAGTTYESSNPFVATIAGDGLITAVANGTTTITARNSGLTDAAAIVVEIGVSLDALELTPAQSTLRASGAQRQLTLTGRFSDGTTRDLTGHEGTRYESTVQAVAAVGAAGLVTAGSSGETTITARHAGRSATAAVHVAISEGVGFLRGEVFDDTRGQPLAGAVAMLLSDGGGPLNPMPTTMADDRGRFTLAGRAGESVVRVQKPGFTIVERRVSIPVGSAATLVDARLTPVSPAGAATSSAFGGVVRDQSDQFALQVPPGGIASDLPLSIVPVSPQGLAGRLPLGWSPVVAAAIEPADVLFAVPATVSFPNTADLPPGTPLMLARYSTTRHEWVAESPVVVSADRLTVASLIQGAGQLAVIVPDPAPNTPPPAVVGEAILGIVHAETQAGFTAEGDVIPRSAPPGEGVRAIGRIGVNAPTPLPSGVLLQARVGEQFDLLDQSRVVTQPFTQDIVVYQLPRPPTGGRLGATFPITPSRSFTIQQLMLGVIRLDITPFVVDGGVVVVGAGGGSVTSAAGDTLELPPGALAQSSSVELRRLTAGELSFSVTDFDLLAALRIEAVGATFNQPAGLSIPAPSDVTAEHQVFVAQLYPDPFAVRRLRLVSVARLQSGRLVSDRAISGLTLPGITGEGEYLFLRSTRPYGFTSGLVSGPGGPAARLGALVTSTSGPFSDVSRLDGRFIVASPASVADNVRAIDPPTRAAVVGASTPPARDAVVALDLALAATGLFVVNVSPAAGAANVALDSSVTVDFAAAVDPLSVTEASAALQAAGTPVGIQRTLSADRRRLTLRPSSPLAGRTSFTVVLTTLIRDSAGNALTGYAPVSFTTLDPTRPAPLAAGQIVAELQDEEDVVMVSGAAGSAAARAAVVVTNLRTQESVGGMSLDDGSFRLRLPARIGDRITLTFRDAGGRETTIAIDQFLTADGSTSIGVHGGTIADAVGRAGRIIPNALTEAGLFELSTIPPGVVLPSLPPGLTYADQFTLRVEGATFNRVASLTLTESQTRFLPATAAAAPFSLTGSLTVPGDALTNTSVQFTASAQDVTGTRQTVTANTVIVSASPDAGTVETGQAARFPVVLLTAPREAVGNQQIETRAVAPSGRIDFEQSVPAGSSDAAVFLLARVVESGGTTRLAIVDRLERTAPGSQRLHGAGHELPGLNVGGHYVVVSSSDPLVFLTGHATGSPVSVFVDDLPFVFETDRPNGSFIVPARAGAPFTVHFVDRDSGAVLGTTSGTAPANGVENLGSPLTPPAGHLRLTVTPTDGSVVDIGEPVVFQFSEPIDVNTLGPAALVITDAAGSRVFGAATFSDDRNSVTFKPFRRWRYATTYRWAVASTLTGASGAQLANAASGQFRTFAPVVLGASALGFVSDVAAATSLAVAATDAGLAVLDVASPDEPQVLARQTIEGGANGAALLAGGTIVDRNGQLLAGPLALVSAGNPATAGRLLILDLSTPTAPVLIGSTQLTKAPGTVAPAGVPDVVGVPGAITLTGDGRALVSITDAGLYSVNIGAAIPLDPSRPGLGLGPLYPQTGIESTVGAAVLTGRVVSMGGSTLRVLDFSTLAPAAVVPVTGTAIAALGAFEFDINGDGFIDESAEILDLAAVSGGTDSTLQLYQIHSSGDPTLVSVVRLPGQTAGVSVDATERLAYVGVGSRGLAIVDLEGPASIQPIDGDRNGVDDRLLGVVDTEGAVERISPLLARAVGFVADGAGGLAVMQLLPPRTTLLALDRDPVQGSAGDQESILDTHLAFVTDAGLLAEIDAAVGPRDVLNLVIEEVPEPGGTRLLAFADGTTTQRLVNGLNSLSIRISDGHGSPGSRATLRIQNSGGSTVATFEVHLQPTSSLSVAPEEFLVPEESPVLSANQPSFQLSIGGVLPDGTVLNVTRAGTTFASEDPRVATVDAQGVVTGVAGGVTRIHIANGRLRTTVTVHVDLAVTLTNLALPRSLYTLTAVGAQETVLVDARHSDGTRSPAAQDVATLFSSSDESIVSVDSQGVLTAVGEGSATVSIVNGAHRQEIQVAVELRIPPVVTGLVVEAIRDANAIRLGRAWLRAVVAGSGSLEGIDVTFVVNGAVSATMSGTTDYAGIAGMLLINLATPGAVSVTASVVSPTTGTGFSASTVFTVERGLGDHEPNHTNGEAGRLMLSEAVTGTLDGGDLRDRYAVTTSVPGRLTTKLSVDRTETTANGGLTVRFLALDGTELSRFTHGGTTSEFSQAVSAGEVVIEVETTQPAAVRYSLTARLAQNAIEILAISPLTGVPGTTVTIAGSGFSTDPEDTRVLFGGVVGRLVSASPTTLEVLVPAAGVDGDVVVISGSRRATGPRFLTGTAVPVRLASVRPPDREIRRLDPVTGAEVDVTRLLVDFDPLVSRGSVEAIGSSLGGAIVGLFPATNSYVFEFASNRTIRGLASLARALETTPGVTLVTRSRTMEARAHEIDLRDYSNEESVAFSEAGIFDALAAIRATPRFEGPAFQPIRVAVLDSGFNPALSVRSEFGLGDADPDNDVVTLLLQNQCLPEGNWDTVANTLVSEQSECGPGETPHPPSDTGLYDTSSIGEGHGTGVAGIIAALNNGSGPLSGALNGVLKPGEPPFRLTMYLTRDNQLLGLSAIEHLAATDGRKYDVVNMSWGEFPMRPGTQEYQNVKARWRNALILLADRTLFVTSAGNKGLNVVTDLPGALAAEMAHVVAVGGTGTGADAARRAQYPAETLPPFGRTDEYIARFGPYICPHAEGVIQGGSSCGTGVTLSAPSTNVVMAFVYPQAGATHIGLGTSFAAPLVTSVAALMQAIRPANVNYLSPDWIKQQLVATGVDITSTWGEPMPKLDAFGAVSSLLDLPDKRLVYVADQLAPNGLGIPGAVVYFDVDPLTVEPHTEGDASGAIPLKVVKNGVTLEAGRPRAVAASSDGQTIYAFASTSGPLGDGIAVIDVASRKAVNFIPLSGSAFPPRPNIPSTAFRAFQPRPSMVISKDGRLLYVSTGLGLKIINTVSQKVVKKLADLPAPYNRRASGLPRPTLGNRLALLEQRVRSAGTSTGPGEVGPLEVSADGRRLYVGVRKGGSDSGVQPGIIYSYNIDLYTDAVPNTAALDSQLSRYLTRDQGFVAQSPPSDEPIDMAASPDGQSLYVVNGGSSGYGPPNQTATALQQYALTLATAEGLAISPDLRAGIELDLFEGLTILNAPGTIDVLATNQSSGHHLAAVKKFGSSVNQGWAPSADAGGHVLTSVRFGEVLAKLPKSIAIRPTDGVRALVSFHTTGNFAVLDSEVQPLLTVGSAPATAPFAGTIGVTPAIPLDPQLWPERGAFIAADNRRVDSPDERLQWASQIRYAQSGRFAAATHTGVDLPSTFEAPLPAFTDRVRRALNELGFNIPAGGTSGTNPATGQSVSEKSNVEFQRGGGAVSIINDAAVAADIRLHAGTTVGVEDGARPYYATLPVCAERPPPGSKECARDAVTRVFEYTGLDNTTRTRFSRPIGVTILPIVAFTSPRYGDHITFDTSIRLSCACSTAIPLFVKVFPLDPTTGEPDASPVAPEFQLTLDQNHAATETFGFMTEGVGEPGRRYRIEAVARTGAGQELSRAFIDVTFVR
jgi:hypothetical protein